MNVNPETSLPPDADTATPDDAEPVAKPVRRRRAVKASDETPDAAPTHEVGDPAPVAEASEAVEKPKRRRAAAITPAAVEAEAMAPVAAEFPAAVATAVDSGTAPMDDSNAGESGGAEQGEEAAPEGGDLPRSRRRNRRDRKRNEARDAAPSEEGGAAAPVDAGERFAQVLSGAFDVDGEPEPEPELAEEDPAAAPKRVLLPEPEAPKLHKVLAQSGIGSRRDMEDLIADGHVMVNGEPAHVGQRVSFGDRVQVNGKPVKLRIVPPAPRILAYHKPVGEIVTQDDPQNRPTVFRRLPRLQQGKWQSVGRLDINTEGLLLFTNSGELANQLMHPRFGVEREYAVRLLGTLTEANKAGLLEGVEVEGQTASFKSITEGGGDGANHWYRVVITEGRNREVRKLFDTVGLTVSRLIRIRYGTVVLPLGLKRGVWVDLPEGDVRGIRRLASGDNGPRPDRGDNNPRGARGNNEPRQGGQQPPQQPRNNERQGNRQNERQNDRQRGPRQDNFAPAPQNFANEGIVDRNTDRRPDDEDIDFDPASIPNPLEQTFDKRFVSNPRSPVGGRGFRNGGGGGFGAGGSGPAPGPKRGGGQAGGPKQPDPLQTSLGVFGADAFHRKNRGGGGGQGGGQGGQGGGRGGNRGGGFGGGGGGNSGGGYGGGGGRRGR
jgi:23S rRNA pseudouridine2605 synthase